MFAIMETTTQPSDHQQNLFTYYDYILFCLMLAFSAVIGIWHGCVRKQVTQNDYLFGGKKMNVVPISLSLIASNLSGLALLGFPTDVYYFGAQFILHVLASTGVALVLYNIYLPIFYNLQVTSTYEYIELRFSSKLRVFGSLLYTLNMLLYLPIVVYIPALAFAYASGINIHWITPILCCVCIFYTTIGGFKAVVWTDALQYGIMLGSMIFVSFMGVKSIGGFETVWTRAHDGGRIDFSFDLNPTRRDTVFTIGIGMFFHNLAFWTVNQIFVQRFLSLPSLNDIKWSMIYFLPGNAICITIAIFTGLVIFANYFDCDPFTNKQISIQDQLVPYYVLDVSKSIPGLAGIFIAGLFSAALSTLSSCLNCLSGTIYEDFIAPFMPKCTSEKKISRILKIIVLITGIIAILLTILVERMGNILPVYFVLNGIIGGPLLGIFTLGILFPCVHTKGAAFGTVVSLLVMSYIVIQAQIYKGTGFIKHATKSLSTEGCENPIMSSPGHNSTNDNSVSFEPFFIFKISHYYFIAMGFLIMIFTAVPASLLCRNTTVNINENTISPLVRWTMKQDKRDNDSETEDTLV